MGSAHSVRKLSELCPGANDNRPIGSQRGEVLTNRDSVAVLG